MRPPWWEWDFSNPSLDYEYFQVHFFPTYIEDAKKIMQFMTSARSTILGYLEIPYERKVNVFMYTSPMSYKGYHLGYDKVSSDTREAYISMISPQEAFKERSSRDYIWYKANAIHEYVHQVTFNYYRQATKLDPTSFFSNWWFAEGLAGYIPYYHSSEDIMQRYQKKLKQKINQTIVNGAALKDIAKICYYGEAILVRYLIETYGKGQVLKILSSKETHWEDVITVELGVHIEEFKEKWLRWLEENKGELLRIDEIIR